MALKPLNAADLRNILVTTKESIDALSDAAWVNELSEQEVLLAVERGTPALKYQVAWNSRSTQVLRRLMRDNDIGCLQLMARNTNTPPEVLTALAKTSGIEPRNYVAENPSTPPDTLRALAKEGFGYNLTRNSSTPPDILTDILSAWAKAGDYPHSYFAAEHTATPPDFLIALARSCDSRVRKAVAGNRSTPVNTLRLLEHDDDLEVRGRASNNPVLKTGCFIATVAIGSDRAPTVLALRQFRDRFLLPHDWGRAFADGYYRCAPPVADWIRPRRYARRLVRWGVVKPAALLARIFLRLNP